MPLPFAPKPDESRVYESLKSTLLDAVTPDQLDQLREEVFAQGVDGAEDEYRRLVLLGAASQAASLSGPIPRTQTVAVASNAAGDIYETFAPGENEVWDIVAISGTMATGITRMEYKLYDSTTSQYVEFAELTANGTAELEGYPVTVSYPVTFVTHPRGTYASGTNYTYYSVIRVR